MEGYKCSLTCTTSVSLSPLEAGVKKKNVCQEPGTEAKQRCSVPDDSFQDHFCLHSYYRQYPALPILSIKFYLSILYFANHTVLSTTAVFVSLKKVQLAASFSLSLCGDSHFPRLICSLTQQRMGSLSRANSFVHNHKKQTKNVTPRALRSRPAVVSDEKLALL